MMRELRPQESRQQVNTRAMNTQPTDLGTLIQTSMGLADLQLHCSNLCQDKEPLCLRPSKSFILEGGDDPLDYIYIYKNEGDPSRFIPKHWHYVGFGLSDIHGYGYFYQAYLLTRHAGCVEEDKSLPQLYPLRTTDNPASGFGIELTFRVKCESSDGWGEPPKWPGQLMQALARYVFRSKTVFSVGDHAAWNCSLDGDDESRIEHILMTADPQLGIAPTRLGKVEFIQLVGVTLDELQASRKWNVRDVLHIMKKREETGGEFLVTDMRRGQTIFELDPTNHDRVSEGIKRMGSDMTSISAKHKFSARKPKWFEVTEALNHSGENDSDDIPNGRMKSKFDQSLGQDGQDHEMDYHIEDDYPTNSIENQPLRTPSRMSHESESGLRIENAELSETRFYDNIYLLLAHESAQVLPVVLNGRLAHGKSFTYMSFEGDLVTTFVPERSEIESLVSRDQPYAKRSAWLQIFISEELRQEMLETIGTELDADSQHLPLPRNYSWPAHKLHITVVKEI